MEKINELILFLKGKCDNYMLSFHEYTECRTFLEKLEKKLSTSTDSSEVSETELNELAWKETDWRPSMNKENWIRGFKKCLEMRSKLKSQWVGVDRKQVYSEANDLIVERLFRFYDLKPDTREAIIQAMIDFKFPESPIK